MINDLVQLVRLATDPELRKTIASLASIPTRNKLDWKRDVKTASGSFKGNEPYMVKGFVNPLIEDMKAMKISSEEIKKFRTVFDELIRNAFEHGCQEAKGCRVKVRCTYSTWFILLEISDTGRGFDLNRELVRTNNDMHGLQLVKKIAHKLTADKKGKLLTALLISKPIRAILPQVEKHRGKEILLLKVKYEDDWNYMIADWQPLKEATKREKQRLILIDCIGFDFISKTGRSMKRMVMNFKENDGKFYALVVD